MDSEEWELYNADNRPVGLDDPDTYRFSRDEWQVAFDVQLRDPEPLDGPTVSILEG
jgi:hypothetical protein